MGVTRLTERHPALAVEELIARFVPPPRFGGARFESYLPDTDHPSQAAALAAMELFAAQDGVVEDRRRWFGGRRGSVEAPTQSAGRYLDGGYGVGKTHLLAALWHATPAPAAYLTFAELTAVIGFVGMEAAVAAFAGYRLLCLDEFELDDVANTLMTVTFLRSVVPAGTRVAATSNSLPDRLGEGRFAADDFRREIAAIGAHFDVVRIDGPDYRRRQSTVADPLDEAALALRVATWDARGSVVSSDRFDDVIAHLRQVHPVHVTAMLDGLDAVAIGGLRPLDNQGDALLFVHLVDELYDAELAVAASGCGVEGLFPASYRQGGYRKKYGRCESRLLTLLGEAKPGALTPRP